MRGKSEWAAKRVVQCLVENPGTIIWCLTETSANSIQFQQKLIYKYLPKELKSLGRGKGRICHVFASEMASLRLNSLCLIALNVFFVIGRRISAQLRVERSAVRRNLSTALIISDFGRMSLYRCHGWKHLRFRT